MKKNDLEQPRLISTFEYPLQIEVYQPVFESLPSNHYLDVKKLSKGSSKIDIGFFKGGCCKKNVKAVIKKGKVIRIEAEACEESREEVSEEIREMFFDVVEKLDLPKWKPIPVKELVSQLQQGSYPPRAGTGAGCFYVCYWHYCLFCCNPTHGRPYYSCWLERRKPDVIMGV